MISEHCLQIVLGSYLESSAPQVAPPHYSSWNSLTLQVVWFLAPFFTSFLNLFIFFLFYLCHFHSFLCFCVLPFLFGFHLVSFHCMFFNFAPHHHQHHIIVFFFLPYRREPSHLLNHLVKFVSSNNLLWVSHHILLISKCINKRVTHKICNPKNKLTSH